MQKLNDFYVNEWELDAAYDIRFFVNTFGDNYAACDWALRKMNKEGLINIINDNFRKYYIKHDWYNLFARFDHHNGVKVE